jgi:hypothetical protein
LVAQISRIGWQGLLVADEVSYEHIILAGTLFEGEKPPANLRRLTENAFLVDEVRLFGWELALGGREVFWDRDGKDGAGKLSLLFIRSADPILDGRLVLPQGINPQHPLNTVGQVLLDNPRYDIPRGAQDGVKACLGWVRRAYLPNLRCWVDGRLLPGEWDTEHAPNESLEVETQLEVLRKAFSEGVDRRSKSMESSREAATL